jgi:hypothetical protein
MSAIGLEMSMDTDLAAVLLAAPSGDPDGGCFRLRVLFYGPADEAPGLVAGDQVWLDPMPNAGLLAPLRAAGAQLHLLEAVDVAAASYEYKAAVRARRVSADGHEALRDAMKHAVRRPLATAFAFERRKVDADMSVLNAAAFALWGETHQQPFFASWR